MKERIGRKERREGWRERERERKREERKKDKERKKEEALSTGKARRTPGSGPIPRVPKMSQSIPGKPVFPALPRLSSRGSTHTTVAHGTALWESLVGKPQIP